MYSAGIAAVEGGRYDSLADIFQATVASSQKPDAQDSLVDSVSEAMLQLVRTNVLKQLPGHEKHYVPLSEYLFKLLQPELDDALFVGKNYEHAFDEFEVLYALVVADRYQQRHGHVWAPIGRFGWKHRSSNSAPFTRVVESGRAAGPAWPPLKSGLFGGNHTRFVAISDEMTGIVSKLNWW